jgi:hypothetical protein
MGQTMPTTNTRMTPALRGRFAAALLPLALAACGGDPYQDDGYVPPPLSCSVTDQKAWLGGYMNDWYFWYRLSPRPNPAPYATPADYFDALLYQGTDPAFPPDIWSGTSSTSSFQSFFRDGETLGYGVAVAGNEVIGNPNAPLYVRYVDPNSPAAGRVFRGDQVISINGRSAAQVIAAEDFSGLSALNAGERLTLVVRDGTGDFTVSLTSAVYALQPVPQSSIVLSPLGRRMGYVVVKDMINQANTPLANVFADFRAQGVTDVILDLRYNGGGFVSVGNTVASYVAGARGAGRDYARLLYNDKRAAANNQAYPFTNPTNSLGLPRAFVLMGARTCSASEQVINGLRGAGVQVVAVGDATCGKPVGFNAQDGGCGTTYTAVTFESVNDRNEGRYFDGFAATCPVAEDFTQPMGSATDPLLISAANYADDGFCPAGLRTVQRAPGVKAKRLRIEGGGGLEGMLAK